MLPRDKLRAQIKAPAGNLPGFCAIPGCGRPTMRSAGQGLAEMHCRYHIQFRARQGSHWYPTYKAAELKPYLAVSAEWIEQHRAEVSVSYPLMGLRGLLDGAGRAEPAMESSPFSFAGVEAALGEAEGSGQTQVTRVA